MEKKLIAEHKKLLFLLMPLVITFAFALDIYIPVVPQLVEVFATTPFNIQLTLSLYMLTMGFGQLVAGPLSDQFGRKPVIIFSIFLFLLGSFLCCFLTNIYLFISARSLQALGGCGMMVCAFATIRDNFDEPESGRMMSLLNAAISISPIFAPIIGGYLATCFGWRATFWALILIGIYSFISSNFFLKESLPENNRLNFSCAIFKRYFSLIMDKDYCYHTLCVSVGNTCFFLFFSLSPYLLIENLHISLDSFGYYFAVMGITFCIGSFICAYIIPKIGSKKTLLYSIYLVFFGGIWMSLWDLYSGLSALGFLAPMLAIGVGAAGLIGAGAALTLSPYKYMAGTAAALMGCAEFAIASVVGSIVMNWEITNTQPMALAIIVLTGFCLLFKREEL